MAASPRLPLAQGAVVGFWLPPKRAWKRLWLPGAGSPWLPPLAPYLQPHLPSLQGLCRGPAGPCCVSWCGDEGRWQLLACRFAECSQGHFCPTFPLLKLHPCLLLGPSLLLPVRPQLWGRARSIAPAALPLCPVLLPHPVMAPLGPLTHPGACSGSSGPPAVVRAPAEVMEAAWAPGQAAAFNPRPSACSGSTVPCRLLPAGSGVTSSSCPTLLAGWQPQLSPLSSRRLEASN